jgi:hypothetical protein
VSTCERRTNDLEKLGYVKESGKRLTKSKSEDTQYRLTPRGVFAILLIDDNLRNGYWQTVLRYYWRELDCNEEFSNALLQRDVTYNVFYYFCLKPVHDILMEKKDLDLDGGFEYLMHLVDDRATRYMWEIEELVSAKKGDHERLLGFFRDLSKMDRDALLKVVGTGAVRTVLRQKAENGIQKAHESSEFYKRVKQSC